MRGEGRRWGGGKQGVGTVMRMKMKMEKKYKEQAVVFGDVVSVGEANRERGVVVIARWVVDSVTS